MGDGVSSWFPLNFVVVLCHVDSPNPFLRDMQIFDLFVQRWMRISSCIATRISPETPFSISDMMLTYVKIDIDIDIDIDRYIYIYIYIKIS